MKDSYELRACIMKDVELGRDRSTDDVLNHLFRHEDTRLVLRDYGVPYIRQLIIMAKEVDIRVEGFRKSYDLSKADIKTGITKSHRISSEEAERARISIAEAFRDNKDISLGKLKREVSKELGFILSLAFCNRELSWLRKGSTGDTTTKRSARKVAPTFSYTEFWQDKERCMCGDKMTPVHKKHCPAWRHYVQASLHTRLPEILKAVKSSGYTGAGKLIGISGTTLRRNFNAAGINGMTCTIDEAKSALNVNGGSENIGPSVTESSVAEPVPVPVPVTEITTTKDKSWNDLKAIVHDNDHLMDENARLLSEVVPLRQELSDIKRELKRYREDKGEEIKYKLAHQQGKIAGPGEEPIYHSRT